MSQTEISKRPLRKWLSFRLSTLFLAVTIVAIAFGYRHIRRQIQFSRLKGYVNTNIRKLPERERQSFAKLAEDLLPGRNRLGFIFRENWFIWRLPTANGPRFVLVQGEHIFNVPGTSSAHIHLFDTLGRLVHTSSFSTGWRIDVIDAAIEAGKIKGESLICIRTEPVINGADIARQFYAIIDDSVTLIRIENESGECIPNTYSAPNHMVGPETIVRTEQEWLRALSATNTSEVLRTLTWLGGHHGKPFENPGNILIESFGDATLHARVRENERTQTLLKSLLSSPDGWIGEAAQLAIQEIDRHR